MKKMISKIGKHPFASQIIISLISGIVFGIYGFISELLTGDFDTLELLFTNLLSSFMLVFVWAGIFGYPLVATAYEFIYMLSSFLKKENADTPAANHRKRIWYDIFLLWLGVFYEWIYLETFWEVTFFSDWNVQLYNIQKHAPIYTKSFVTIIVVCLVYIISLILLTTIDTNKRPPLVTVLCQAGVYLGTLFAIVFTIQIFDIGNPLQNHDLIDFYLLLVPLNMIFMAARIMVLEIKAYVPNPERMSKIDSVPLLGFCNRLLSDSKKWPVIAFILMWPLLGILIAILLLFGQSPDSVIKAFTETADYTFSTKIPPQNLYYDEHYLCTVAAGGHKKIVKPLRMGKRHGHAVVVNRQLCIANAFEQILEEKTPKFHRVVRNFYDKYGFPVAKLIKSKTAADIVWFIMKPLEWIFLVVIYMTDVHPEDRIYSQYL